MHSWLTVKHAHLDFSAEHLYLCLRVTWKEPTTGNITSHIIEQDTEYCHQQLVTVWRSRRMLPPRFSPLLCGQAPPRLVSDMLRYPLSSALRQFTSSSRVRRVHPSAHCRSRFFVSRKAPASTIMLKLMDLLREFLRCTLIDRDMQECGNASTIAAFCKGWPCTWLQCLLKA